MTATAPGLARPDTGSSDRRWWILAVLAIAQLMIVVDATIVNIALPSAQRALHISTADRQWVLTAYTLTFGGLLLLGGRVADYVGRKRVLIVGLLGFAGASALGGLAPNAALLFSARALQGAFAALMAPAALSLITVTFTEARERARAFGVYGAIAGGGAAVGLISGGILTEYASWRWCLLVNIPIAILSATAAYRLIPESRREGHTRYDVPGAVTSTLGLAILVYGVTKATTDGWASATTLSLLGVAAVLLAAFVAIERTSTHALLPLRVVTERNRGGSYLATLLVGVGMMGAFLFLTYYFQQTLHYSALRTGVGYLPFSLGIITGAGMASRLAPRLQPRILMGIGLAMATAGMLLFTQLGLHSAFWSDVFPAEITMAFGMGLVFVAVNSTALAGISPSEAGVASALINATQQVGGSVGTALLNTISATATATYLRTHHGLGSLTQGLAAVHGYSVAFVVAAATLGLALVVVLVLVNVGVGGGAAGDPDRDRAGDRAGDGEAMLAVAPIPA